MGVGIDPKYSYLGAGIAYLVVEVLHFLATAYLTYRLSRTYLTLIIIQGLYVIFLLPDIWPFFNYSMFGKVNPAIVTSSFEFCGLTNDGKEVPLDSKKAFLPFDITRLKKGVTRILNREFFIREQEKGLNPFLITCVFCP